MKLLIKGDPDPIYCLLLVVCKENLRIWIFCPRLQSKEIYQELSFIDKEAFRELCFDCLFCLNVFYYVDFH